MAVQHFQIRDPIHGVIFISRAERAVIDASAFQRLRNIKQVGFADFAFPCATHSRYSHSLGTMFIAGRIFDRVMENYILAQKDRESLRQVVRLAALLHDIGHPPLSHTTEVILPKLGNNNSTEKGRHEDYTLRIILDSPLTKIIEDNFSAFNVSPQMVANLLSDQQEDSKFVVANRDFAPVLRQIISSEIDADRMDYLLRDSFFCGVSYGKFDSDWLIENLIPIECDNKIYLGLKARAIFAFEDFLLSRYHMFLSVYFHHTPVIMEKMLLRFFSECPDAFLLPRDIMSYLDQNDVDLWHVLKKSSNSWAQRIIQRNPYVMLYENIHGPLTEGKEINEFERITKELKADNLDVITSESKTVLSNYIGEASSPLFVENGHGRTKTLLDYSPLYSRYETPTSLNRIYVDPKQMPKAKNILTLLEKL